MTADELAVIVADQARFAYESEGRLDAMVRLHSDEQSLIVLLADTDDVVRSAAGVVLALGRPSGCTLIATVAESWIETRTIKPEPGSLARGELERRNAEGDPNVFTCLLTTVLDVRTGDIAAVSDIEHTDVVDQRWGRGITSEFSGRAPNMLQAAYAESQPAELTVAIRALEILGLVRVVAILPAV